MSCERAAREDRLLTYAPTARETQSRLALGVDFGGTKIEANLVAPDGAVAWRRRVPNPGSYDGAIAALAALVAEADGEAGGRCSVGIGAPGSPSPRTGLMRNSNSTYLNGRPFAADLETTLGRPVRIANDANCLAVSEAANGAAAGAATVFALVIGTGVGGGIVVAGREHGGAHGIAGEVGHLPLPWPAADELPSPPCWCGLTGCIESWISGTGLARAFLAETGRALAAPGIVDAARDGDADAGRALERYVDRLGRVLAMIANILDPDIFVLGGGMSNVPEIYPPLPDVIRAHTFSDGWDGRVVPARWGDASGVRGAARLWPQAG